MVSVRVSITAHSTEPRGSWLPAGGLAQYAMKFPVATTACNGPARPTTSMLVGLASPDCRASLSKAFSGLVRRATSTNDVVPPDASSCHAPTPATTVTTTHASTRFTPAEAYRRCTARPGRVSLRVINNRVGITRERQRSVAVEVGWRRVPAVV